MTLAKAAVLFEDIGLTHMLVTWLCRRSQRDLPLLHWNPDEARVHARAYSWTPPRSPQGTLRKAFSIMFCFLLPCSSRPVLASCVERKLDCAVSASPVCPFVFLSVPSRLVLQNLEIIEQCCICCKEPIPQPSTEWILFMVLSNFNKNLAVYSHVVFSSAFHVLSCSCNHQSIYDLSL
ncbi:hypothetical protein GQ55_7G152100 [Panicum hallii var. hallii]|uniref:Uncharacterized protein n=1 Tax=Panicum hallii var. hallii TaxID=1504633 RepID=A0A2T7CVB2_9POAL|nr:hypothetical protein GQ55_7G152100 [Panicum hallii var. hallii]